MFSLPTNSEKNHRITFGTPVSKREHFRMASPSRGLRTLLIVSENGGSGTTEVQSQRWNLEYCGRSHASNKTDGLTTDNRNKSTCTLLFIYLYLYLNTYFYSISLNIGIGIGSMSHIKPLSTPYFALQVQSLEYFYIETSFHIISYLAHLENPFQI